ncbi:MAG: VOC family protein [Candidatus Dormibacteraeota bacterium]|nr:VOC family protein [Candidatus Dormibacteraeota bacterium]
MEMKAAVSIAAATGVGAVHLAVTDGDRALRFYRDYVGLTSLASDDDSLRLGAGGRELVVLHPGAERPVVPRTSGLYHLALLVQDRRELARVIARLGALRWDQYPTDHVMTKANYLWDPDGNGIEVYCESPEDGTLGFANGTFVAYDRDGRQRSGRDPIDLTELFSNLADSDSIESPLPEATRMGHVHLHVADVEEALGFYHDLVGFDVMGQVPGVGFVSAGGYHHHIGLNTWAGQGARPAPPGSAGLRHFTIEVPTGRDLDAIAGRLEQAGVPVSESGDGFSASDPSANAVHFKVRAPAP